jgi:CxxC motif-containing protein (DUF1111 family)
LELPLSRRPNRLNASSLVTALLVLGCGETASTVSYGEWPLAGGDTTIVNRTSNAYSFPAPNLTESELNLHLEGDVAFEARFVTPPATLNPGLGPLFNNNGCINCHLRDGRGLPVAGQGPLGSPLLVQVSLASGEATFPGGPVPVPGIGAQLQDHATYGYEPEVSIVVRWIEQAGEYGDGEPHTLERPALDITLASGEPLPGDVLISARIPPPVFGLGLLEAVPEEDLLALADPDDANGDGISGRANYVWEIKSATTRIGRFGWKAGVPSVVQQSATAYFNDVGVTSPMFPEPDGASDIDEHTLSVVGLYMQTLAVPRRDGWDDPIVRRGEALFREVGCGSCHVEELRTGVHSIGALTEQTIHPYTDLLLHNMGFELADGRPEYLASGTEWRTPPLWGLGLAQTVLPYSRFLHDGRARTIEEAILWHGGEAERSKEAFRTMPAGDRSALLEFLHSL